MIKILNWSSSSLILLSLLSCTLMRPREFTAPIQIKKSRNVCKTIDRYNFVSNNPSLTKNISITINRSEELNFREVAAIWTLLQMNIRPDLASVNSDLYILLRERGQTSYRFFSPIDNESYSYLQGVDFLLGRSPEKMTNVARFLHKQFRKALTVSKEFSDELQELKEKLIIEPSLKKAYLRGEQVIGRQETLPRLHFPKIVKRYLATKRTANIKKTLKPVHKGAYCNLATFQEISTKEIIFHPFALFDNKGNSMIALSTQQFKNPKSWEETMLFMRGETKSNAFLCLLNNQNLIASFNVRAPGQIIKSLVGESSLNQSIEKARLITLNNPKRIMYEYNRGSEKQYQRLLQGDIPIYGAQSLGLIWAYDIEDKRFIIDPRFPSNQSCNIRHKDEVPFL